jgi:hypothetical protein
MLTLAGSLVALADCSRARIESRPTPPDPVIPVRVEAPPVPQPVQLDKAAEPAPYVHIIRRSGETLGAIALWYTGALDNWKRLVAANNGLDPRKIQIGDKILIPQNLMKTRRPMPAAFMTPKPPVKAAPTPRAQSAPAAKTSTTPVETDQIDLFGPIDIDQPDDSLESAGLPLETIE